MDIVEEGNVDERLRVAIVGCGRMGRVHAERIAADGRAVVVACTDAVGAAAESLREVAPDARPFDDLESLLAGSEVDAAVVATPTAMHFDQVVACRTAGLHVLCEKPLADTRERIADLVAATEADGPVLMVGYQRRFWSTYRTLRREVRSGRWGAVRAVTFHNVEDWQQTIAGTWRDDPELNWGGFVGDRGSHEIDGLFFLTGLAATDVFARVDTCGSRVPITATISAVLAGNVPVAMDFVGHGQYRGEDLTIHCERADWMLRGPVPDGQEVWLGTDGRMERYPDDRLEPGSDPTTGFLDIVLSGAENTAPPSCALPVYDFTAAVLESGRKGVTMPVPSPP